MDGVTDTKSISRTPEDKVPNDEGNEHKAVFDKDIQRVEKVPTPNWQKELPAVLPPVSFNSKTNNLNRFFSRNIYQ